MKLEMNETELNSLEHSRTELYNLWVDFLHEHFLSSGRRALVDRLATVIRDMDHTLGMVRLNNGLNRMDEDPPEEVPK